MKTSGIEDPNVNQQAMLTLLLTKVPKTYNGEKTASSTNVAGTTGYLHAEN
jgi:hypothetical protein